MPELDLSDDCANCAALCCIAYAFEKGQGFGDAKDAGTPCPHLDISNHCKIHAKRTKMNYQGCIAYTCYGAGQRIFQDVFDGNTWRDRPQNMDRMIDAFLVLRKIHEAVFLLNQADKLNLPTQKRQQLTDLRATLTAPESWSEAELDAFDQSPVPGQVRSFLKSLASYAQR